MKPNLTLAIAAATAVFSALSTASANDILIYKHTDSRPWVQYSCLRPTSTNPASPAVPLTAVSGKYTETQWWVYDATTSTVQKITFWSQPILGAKPQKKYEVGPQITLGKASVNGGAASDTYIEMFVQTHKYGVFKHSLLEAEDIEDGLTDLDGDGNDDFQRVTLRHSLLGDAKYLSLSLDLELERATSKLTGDWRYSEDTQLKDGAGQVSLRRQVIETGKPTLTLDVPKTKLANGGDDITAYYAGSPQSSGTLAYAITLLENELYKLDYDKQ